MKSYSGSKCIVCERIFTDDDDIVVCPDCGTPYHRGCYLEKGSCINTELHENGGSWKPEYVNPADNPDGEIVCPKCGETNPPLTLFCEKCGMPLAVIPHGRAENDEEQNVSGQNPDNPFEPLFTVNFSDPLCGLNPDEEFEDAKLSEIADYVGTNTFYFLPLFKIMKETGRKFTWNLPGLIFPEYYYGYRKMYGPLILVTLVKMIISLPLLINWLNVYDMSGTILHSLFSGIDIHSADFALFMQITSVLSYAVIFVTATFTNWFYYRYVLNRISRIKFQIGFPEENPTEEDKAKLKEKLQQKGGTSKLFAAVLVLLSLVASVIMILPIK